MFQHVENTEKKPAPKVWEKQKKGKKKAVKPKKKTKQAFNWKASTVSAGEKTEEKQTEKEEKDENEEESKVNCR